MNEFSRMDVIFSRETSIYLINRCLHKRSHHFYNSELYDEKRITWYEKKLQPTDELPLEKKLRDYTLLGVESVDKISLHFCTMA